MEDHPLISVCIPCHNGAPWIAAVIDSILAQTWPQVEIIVVDDGSTDESGQIVAGYENCGVRLIEASCGSAAKARNIALAASKGPWIQFLDADDLLEEGSIEAQMRALKTKPETIGVGQCARFQGECPNLSMVIEPAAKQPCQGARWLLQEFQRGEVMMQVGMFLISRVLIEKAGGWDEELTLIDDFEFFSRLLCHAEEVIYTPQARVYYRSNLKGTLSGRKDRRSVESAYHSLLRGTGHLLAVQDDAETRQACADLLQDFIHTYYPDHPDLRDQMARRVTELGGSKRIPTGPPRFHQLRKLIGWRLARRVQRWVGR